MTVTDQRRLGRTGLVVSRVGFGTGGTGGLMVRGAPGERRKVVEAALDAGVTYFDTSPLYGDGRSETNLGAVLREIGATPVVSTKIDLRAFDAETVRHDVAASIDRSRRRLGRDRLDLVFLHDRVGHQRDPGGRVLAVEDVIGPVADALDESVARGRVRATGLTALGKTGAVAAAVASGRFAAIQAYYNVLNPSAFVDVPAAWRAQDFGGLARTAAGAGLGVVAIRAVAAGALSDAKALHPLAKAYSPLAAAEVEADRVRGRVFQAVGGGQLPIAQLAMRFVLSEPLVATMLIGVSELGHLDGMLAAADAGPLDHSVLQEIDGLYRQLYETA